MIRSIPFFVLFPLFVYARVHPVLHPTINQIQTKLVSPNVIAKACETSSEKAFCISVLMSQSISNINDLKQATFVALHAASGEAVATSEFVKITRQKEEGKDVLEDSIEEEVLVDCSESYTSIVEMLADATSALLTGPESDVKVEINAAIAAADTCARSISKGRKTLQVEEAAKKNQNVKKFCLNALSIYNVYSSKGH